jgi:hypothetical protein
MNATIAAITNTLYTSLSKREFFCLSVFLSELSKAMFNMEVLRGICFAEEEKKAGEVDGHDKQE